MTYNQGYKPQYQQGSKPYQGSQPQYNQGYQGQGQCQGHRIQQPRIDFRMVLPTQWELEQFLEMTKDLTWIENKYTDAPHDAPQRSTNDPSTNTATCNNKDNQKLDESTKMTSQPSQITNSTQIGNILVEQLAKSLGKGTDHIIEALEEVFGTSTLEQDLECQVVGLK